MISGGNDEKVLVHDVTTGKPLDIFPHDESVYCVNCHPEQPELFTTACSDGRILLFDLRLSNEDPVMLQGSSYPYHSVSFNPVDSKLLVTANQENGASLIDCRKPNKAIMFYGRQRKKSAMCANFSPDGTQIFVLGRKSNPLLYNLASPLPIAEFDHPGYWNRCTMKSGTFGAQDYVFSGSDNFAIYAWKVPDQDQDFQYIKRADFVLQGHQSIVNQVRYNSTFDILASSGVEKRIKLWSPFDIGIEDEENSEEKPNRRISRSGGESRFALHVQSVELHGEFDTETTEENPKMLAFFDTLVKRDFSDSDSEASTLSETESDDIDSVIAKKRDRIKARLSSQDSDYVQNTIQTAREVLKMTTEENSESEHEDFNLDSSSTLSKIDSDIEQAILDLEHPSSDESTDDEEVIESSNSFKKSKNGKIRCYRKSNK